MNDDRFDQLVRESIAWEADHAAAELPPKRLAFRRLAVRLSGSRPVVAGTSAVRPVRLPALATSLAGLAVVAVAAVLVVGYVLGPGSRSGASGPVFVSDRYGYSWQLPDDRWQVTEWPGEWELGTFLDAGNPGTDYFETTTPSRTSLVYAWLASQPIPEGMTFDGWLYVQDGVTAAAASCFALQGGYEDVRVDGERGRLGVYRCPNFQGSGVAWSTVQVLVGHAGRGYAIYFWPEQEPAAPPLTEVRLDALRWLSEFEFADPDE